MSIAIAGHGATWSIEIDPAGSPGVFTPIAELNGDLTGLGISRPVTETTPHQDTIDSSITGVLKRKPLNITSNFVYGDTTHAALEAHILGKVRFGMRFLGPSSGAGAGVDEIIASGEVTEWDETNPVREGARTMATTIVMSKAMKRNGVSYGSAA